MQHYQHTHLIQKRGLTKTYRNKGTWNLKEISNLCCEHLSLTRSKIVERTSPLVLRNVSWVASDEGYASLHLGRTPSPNMRIYQFQSGHKVLEEMDDPEIVVSPFLSEI